jgi:hypothetical protein
MGSSDITFIVARARRLMQMTGSRLREPPPVRGSVKTEMSNVANRGVRHLNCGPFSPPTASGVTFWLPDRGISAAHAVLAFPFKPKVASSNLVGRIRLQWWTRDAPRDAPESARSRVWPWQRAASCPAGEVEFLAGGERDRSAQMDGVVGTQWLSAGARSGHREKRVGDGVAEDAAPDVLQIIERTAELGRGQPAAPAHPGQRRGCLDVRDRDGANAVRLAIGARASSPPAHRLGA